MKTNLMMLAVLAGALTFAANAQAQYVMSSPTTAYYAPAAPVAVPAGYAPVVIARRPIMAYYGPAPAPVQRAFYGPIPAYSPYAAVAPAPPVPVTSMYAPSYYAPAAYVAPAPVAVAPYVAARPVVVGRTIYGTGQVYVPGQPVLNTVRAITP